MPKAARLHDPISHSRSLDGLIAGAVIGGLAAVAFVVFAPVTIPAVIGGAAVAGTATVVGGAALGAGLGELVGSFSFMRHDTGDIAGLGSPDVWINGLRAARAHVDRVNCHNHSVGPVIAQGSSSVFINGKHAARTGDLTACGAKIEQGSPNVVIGGEAFTTDDVVPEVPSWVSNLVFYAGLASATVLLGPEAAALGWLGSKIGGAAMHSVASRMWGDGSDMDKLLTAVGSFGGGFGGAKGGLWIAKNYRVETIGLGTTGGGMRIVPREPPSTVNPAHVAELKANGVKFTETDLLATGRTADGKVVFLEKGNPNAGMEHVMRHAEEFEQAGIPKDQIQPVVMKAATEGKVVGYQGKSTGRPIVEIEHGGRTHRIAVTTGNNGYIVGANPKGGGK